MEHNQQSNHGFVRQFQSLINGILHHSHPNAEQPHTQASTTIAGPSEPPPYTAVVDRETSPVASATLYPSTSGPMPSVSLEPSPPDLDYESDDSMPSLQAASETSDEQDNEDVEMLTAPESNQSGEASTSSSTSVPSNPSSTTRNSRRARVEEEPDEDDLRESNRQRMNSPVPSGEDDHLHDHHFHPDMEAHQADDQGAPIFSRLRYIVDILPPNVHPGPQQGGMPPTSFPFPLPSHAPATNDAQDTPPPQDQTLPPAPGVDAGGQARDGAADFYTFLNLLREQFGNMAGMPWAMFGEEEQDDPARAKKLLSGLEEVPVGLMKRMQSVGGDEKPVCAVCFDGLLDPDAGFQTISKDEEPTPMEVESDTQPGTSSSEISDEEKAALETLKHKVVVLPCSHVFHASCLLPWFTRPHCTTCPTCRFDVDPESLTLSPPSIRRTRRRRTQPEAAPTPNAREGAEEPMPPVEPSDASPIAQLEGERQGQPQAGPQPRVRARRSIRAGDLPFGLVIDVSVFPGPPLAPQPGQGPGPTFHTPLFGTNPGNMPFFEPTTSQPAPNTAAANPNPTHQPFNPGMAGLGFIPAEFQFVFGPPPRAARQPAANTNTNPQNPPATQTTAPHPQATGPAPQAPPPPPRGPQIHIHGDPGASALLADLLGLGRFQPPPPAGSDAAEQQRRQRQEPLPSFQEFINMSIPPQGPAPANPPPTDGATPATPPPPQTNGRTTEAQVHAMADTLARTLFQGIMFGVMPPPSGAPNANGNGNVPPVLPGPIPFNIPTSNAPRPPPGEKKQWTPPPPPGLTLHQRVERKEHELGLRCSDISCGLGPTDEDPTPIVDPRAVRQISLRPLPAQGAEGKTAACEHTFHPSCLVSAERVAGWSGADQKREVEGEEDIEVSCPVCRAVGCISRADWDEGACALA